VRPLIEGRSQTGIFDLSDSAPAWFLADLGDLGPNPWDAAHGRLADALGLDGEDVIFAEPDLLQTYPDANEVNVGGSPFAVKQPDCTFQDQHNDERPAGPGFAWHLGDQFSQLASARSSVTFTDPGRTTIAHIDTGYDPVHSARPARIRHDLEHNFVNEDGTPNSAADPNRQFLFDNSGHGTGTIGILAGQSVAQNGDQPVGGAPEADIVPLRIANSVVMFFTSAFAAAIHYAVQQKCDVVSISMGGLPSRAWNDAVNAAYEAGVCIVAASGDCYGGLPTHHVVYPARYHRSIAACGVMADGRPYYGLPVKIIEGSWGPDSAMTAALAGWTPNAPWAKLGCGNTIDMDGAGTSAATPQVAAAVALWYEKYKQQLPRDWRRVEAVRNALFRSARRMDPIHFGNGILQAQAALAIAPAFNLPKTPADHDSFAFFRIITGLGITEPTAREQMLNLELTQRYLMNPDLQEAVPEPATDISTDSLRRFMEALIADTKASQRLRRMAASRYSVVFDTPLPSAAVADLTPPTAVSQAKVPIRNPPYRRIRTYAVDPSLSTQLTTATINQGLLKVPWEDLRPGPTGEYAEVTDNPEYGRVDLNDPRLLAQDGFAPSEGNPQFHQQMTYAVAMTTISHFEAAMGRRVLWRARIDATDPFDDSQYAQRLAIEPHAFAQENAFYDPRRIALRFGYFKASANDPGDHVPGSTVYTCLSHDIVAHETTHAILDGMHRRFNEPTNPDVLAFHEGFADIVALMQHFTMTEILRHQIARTRGDLESESMLGSLAMQFGRSTGKRGGLREAIGTLDANGMWRRLVPDPSAYQKVTEPHARGALLVAAVFDAFLAIYKVRTADLYRIYTGGTGVLQPGAVHPDLVDRLAAEATKSATHVLRICIRALDYVPPVDITFGEYLRGIITADADFVGDDPYGYRVAFVESFRRRGIYPSDLPTLSVDTLLWQSVDLTEPMKRYGAIVGHLKRFADECLYIDDRKKLFDRTRKERRKLHDLIKSVWVDDPGIALPLGIDPALPFEVHELRRAERAGPDGSAHPQVIVAITQQRDISVPGASEPMKFHGGSTLIIDLKKPELKYAIRKRIWNDEREAGTRAFLERTLQNPLMAMLLDPARLDRFAALHALADLED
jgi:subtilisin family serine protease